MHKSVLPTCRPASIFMFLSLAFGSIIIFANLPLRGPDEIAHFLRTYSYARGELLPVTEINARRGIFVSPGLYNQLYFFKTAGEVFAKSAEEGMRYGHIMAEYSRLANIEDDETNKRLCSRHSLVPRATIQLPTFLISSQRKLAICSSSIFPPCCS